MKKTANFTPRAMQKPEKKSLNLSSALNIFLGITCVALGIAYLVQMNNLTIQGFSLKEMKANASILAEENEDLHAKALSLQSYSTLSPRLDSLNMVAVEEITYLKSDEAVVAKK